MTLGNATRTGLFLCLAGLPLHGSCARQEGASPPQASERTHPSEPPTIPGVTTAGAVESAASRAGTGRIRGTVTLRGAAPVERSELIMKDSAVCGSRASVTRLALGPNNGIGQTFVYLDGVTATAALEARGTTEVTQEGCNYGPHAMTLDAGAALEVVNNDPILHNVHGQESTADGMQTLFNVAQPVRGQRTRVPAAFDKPGIITLTCEAGHPWMTANILVAAHPYVATTGTSGEFVIENVPPGRYPIKMWHEGVQLTRILRALQRYEYEAPYEQSQEVIVSPGAETVVHFELELRPPS